MRKRLPIILLILGFSSITTGIVLLNNETKYYKSLKREYLSLEKRDAGVDELNALEKKGLKLNKVYQKDFSPRVLQYRKYLETKNLIDIYQEDEDIPVEVMPEKIKEIEKCYNVLLPKYKVKLDDIINSIINNNKDYSDFQKKIDDLFTDKEKTAIKDTATFELLNTYNAELDKFTKKDFVQKNKENIKLANQLLEKRIKEIEAAWLILNVPYISQNENNILNGCEAATMLMSLKYKGYLTDMSLADFVLQMPFSPDSDAYKGFTHDIYTKEPETVPHWIAPPPLIKFAKEVSGNQNIIDSTGWSIDELDKEIDKGNPVIIYLIDRLHEPDEIVEGVPKNLHVMLLTGYNKITGQQYVVDPWKHFDGQIIWKIDKNVLVNQYSYVGMKSVVIR